MESFIDQDLYSFTVGQAIYQHHSNIPVTYKFIDRNHTKIDKRFDFLIKLKDKIDQITSRRITKGEQEYLRSLGYFTEDYLDFLQSYKFNKNDVNFWVEDGELKLTVNGLWENTIFWEVPLLAAITELYLEDKPMDVGGHIDNLMIQGEQMEELNFCEFGTRRRRNYDYQFKAVSVLRNHTEFLGTSNVHLAKEFGEKPIGTTSHQWIMGNSAFSGVGTANAEALWRWVETYQGKLGVALTDTFTTDVFLRSFNGVLPRVFDGVRQDSGNPIDFAVKIQNHYVKHNIDPSSKTIYFSDGLTPVRCQEIEAKLLELDIRLRRVYCIGTSFTNDHKLNIVMKLTKVNGKDVVKLSDEPGKNVGSKEEIIRVKEILGCKD